MHDEKDEWKFLDHTIFIDYLLTLDRHYAVYNDLTDLTTSLPHSPHLVDLDRLSLFREWQESDDKVAKEVIQADYFHKVHEVIPYFEIKITATPHQK